MSEFRHKLDRLIEEHAVAGGARAINLRINPAGGRRIT